MEDAEYRNMYTVEATHWWYVSLHGLILRSLPRRRPLTFFDAGCGTGRLMELLQPFGTAEGCDVSTHALAFCRERGLSAVRECDLNAVALEPDRYDVITSIDVLYHRGIRDDRQALERLRSGLRPGGTLILQVPAYAWLRSSHDDTVHTARRYTRSAVIALLRSAGFKVEKATYRVTLLFPAIAAVRLLQRVLPAGSGSDVRRHSPLINRLLLAVMEAERTLLERISLPFGTSVFAVARRPDRREGA